MSRHIAFFNIPAVGHLFPSLPLVTELARRGHRVSYAGVPDRAALIQGAGATLVPYESSRPSDTDQNEAAPPPQGYIAHTLLNFVIEAELTMPQLEPAFVVDPPDVVLFDRMAFAGGVFARKHNIPAIQMWPMMVSGPQWSWVRPQDLDHPTLQTYQTRVAKFLANQGVPAQPEDFLTPEVWGHLAFTPRAFQSNGELFGDSFHFVGPCLGERSGQQTWQPPADGRPVLLVTMGTIRNQRHEFYRACFEQLGGTDWHVVLVVGKRFDHCVLGRPPANFEVAPEVPQVQVLRAATAMVSHGGMGGVMEAISAGVPQVILPYTREQQNNGARVAELGLGLHLSDWSDVRSAVEAVAGDELMRARIAQMRHEIDSAGGAARAADVVEECLAEHSK